MGLFTVLPDQKRVFYQRRLSSFARAAPEVPYPWDAVFAGASAGAGTWLHATGITPLCSDAAHAHWNAHLVAAREKGVPIRLGPGLCLCALVCVLCWVCMGVCVRPLPLCLRPTVVDPPPSRPFLRSIPIRRACVFSCGGSLDLNHRPALGTLDKLWGQVAPHLPDVKILVLATSCMAGVGHLLGIDTEVGFGPLPSPPLPSPPLPLPHTPAHPPPVQRCPGTRTPVGR